MERPFSVVALIVDEDENVLAITRRNKDDDWGLVGGKVDPSDTDAVEAIRREAREEAGIEIQREDLVHIYTRFDGRVNDDKICFCYFVRHYKGRPRAMENGFKVRWVPFETLLLEKNTFVHYNQGLYAHLKANPLPQRHSTFSL